MMFIIVEMREQDVGFTLSDIIDFLCITIQNYKSTMKERCGSVDVENISKQALRYFCAEKDIDYKTLKLAFDNGAYNELPYIVKMTIADIINSG